MINDQRYQKHLQLSQFGAKGQEKLAKAKILVIGAGGLGTPVAQYLNSIGVGTLGLMDQDKIAVSNLSRQPLYCPEDVGSYKVTTLVKWLQKQNPQTQLITHLEYLTTENALDIILAYDLVIDACDNLGTRYLINDACVILGKPFIYGGVHEFEGQISTFNFHEGPTYRCLFPEDETTAAVPNCDQNGVLGALPSLIGSYQAIEAIKVITGLGEPLSGKLLVVDVLAQTHLQMKFSPIPENQQISELKPSYDQLFTDTCTVPNINIALLMQWINEKKPMRIIDVREPHAFPNKRLDTSENIPIQEVEKRLNYDHAEVPIVLICQSGRRSALAAKILLAKDPNLTVFNLSGGLNSLSPI